jgi:hypothetical protein
LAGLRAVAQAVASAGRSAIVGAGVARIGPGGGRDTHALRGRGHTGAANPCASVVAADAIDAKAASAIRRVAAGNAELEFAGRRGNIGDGVRNTGAAATASFWRSVGTTGSGRTAAAPGVIDATKTA